MPLSERQREILNQVIAAITARPDSFDMQKWLVHDETIPPSTDAPEPYCGTVACIAGHIAILNKILPSGEAVFLRMSEVPDTVARRIRRRRFKDQRSSGRVSGDDSLLTDICEIARSVLNISSKKASTLFYVEDWPEDFRSDYEFAETAEARAAVTAQRIRWFMDHGK
jgi:hypothetical protein